MAFCNQCGNELAQNSKFCEQCGNPVNATNSGTNVNYGNQSNQSYNKNNFTYIHPALVSHLSSKVNTNGIIWLVIGILQVLGGFIGLLDLNIFLILTGVVGIINLVSATKDFNYAKQILRCPVGITAQFAPVGGLVASLVYNVLFSFIGVIAIIYGFTVRSFVMTNAMSFEMIESDWRQQN